MILDAGALAGDRDARCSEVTLFKETILFSCYVLESNRSLSFYINSLSNSRELTKHKHLKSSIVRELIYSHEKKNI